MFLDSHPECKVGHDYVDPRKVGCEHHSKKTWYEMSSTEQEIHLEMAAKKNYKLREWKPAVVTQIEAGLEFIGTWLDGSLVEQLTISKVEGGQFRLVGWD